MKTMKNTFNYRWSIKDGLPIQGIQKHGKKVFTTFSCGGGSSLGYKLSGYDVFAANDIDPEMKKVYVKNHHPKYYFLSDVRKLIEQDYPPEFYDLDLLDGSPPCSTFSMSGSREKAWGKQKVFREGQAMQTLDDLFFDFIALAKKLQPKVVVSENVRGLIQGNAKGYVKEIFQKFDDAGYETQLFLLNAATMGVPQKRERVFFLSRRKDLNLPKIVLNFNEENVLFKDVKTKNGKLRGELNERMRSIWDRRRLSDADFSSTLAREENKPNLYFNHNYVKDNKVCNTITSNDKNVLYSEPRYLNEEEIKLIGTFPQDYDFLDIDPSYLIGMSVPPVMMAQVAKEVYLQWLSRLQ